MGGAQIHHSDQHPVDLQIRVDPVLNLLDGVLQQSDCAQREELSHQRDDHTVGGGERVDGQQPQAGLAVDDDHIVVITHCAQGAGEDLFAANLGDQLDLCCGEVDVGRHQVYPGNVCGDECVGNGDVLLQHHVVNRGLQLMRISAQSGRERPLGVEVDHEHPAAVLRECGGQIDGGGGLPHPALLVDHGDHPGRPVGGQHRWFGELALGAAGGTDDRITVDGEQRCRLFGQRVLP